MRGHNVDVSDAAEPITAPVLSDANFRRLLKRLKPSDAVAVDMPDMDAATASRLAAKGVVAVLNASESITGRSPSVGAPLLLDQGIAVVDRLGIEFLDEVQQGETVTIQDGSVSLRGGFHADGMRLTPEIVVSRLALAREFLSVALGRLGEAVSDHLRPEWAAFFQGAMMADLEPIVRGRIAIVVTGGPSAVSDLRSIRRRLHGSAVIATADGYDALRRLGIAPHVLVGHGEELSDGQLVSGARIVLLEDPRAPTDALERCRALGVESLTLEWPAGSSEAAEIIAADNGARLVLAIGAPYSFTEVTRSGESGIATAIISRLRLGPRVLDFETYKRLHPGIEVPIWAWVAMGVLGVVAGALAWRVVFG